VRLYVLVWKGVMASNEDFGGGGSIVWGDVVVVEIGGRVDST
jgi:hypothetical protein